MRYALLALACMVVLAGCGGSGPPWRVLPPVPEARTGMAGAAVSNRVAVVGGLDAAGDPSPRVDLFDVRRRRWLRLPDLPEGLDRAMAASRGGRLYVMGGFRVGERGWQASEKAWVLYDRRWHPLPPMPEPRAAGGAAIVRNRIYVVGGATGVESSRVATVSLYLDLRTLRWSGFKGLTPPRRDVGVAALGGYVYAVGGRTGGPATNSARAESYDPVVHAWSDLPDAPTRRGGGAATTAGRMVVSAGGAGPNGALAQVDAYDPATGAWRSLPPSPRPRVGAALVGVGRQVFQAGGSPEPGAPPNAALLALRVSR